MYREECISTLSENNDPKDLNYVNYLPFDFNEEKKENTQKSLNYFFLLTSLSSLNRPSRRFLKAEIIDNEISLALGLTYVDAPGHDAIDPTTGLKYSIKSGQSLFQKTKNKTKQIALVNQHGKSDLSRKDNIDYDYLILVSTGQKGLGLVTKSNVFSFMKEKESQVKTEISFSDIIWIIEPQYNFSAKQNPENDRIVEEEISKLNNNLRIRLQECEL